MGCQVLLDDRLHDSDSGVAKAIPTPIMHAMFWLMSLVRVSNGVQLCPPDRHPILTPGASAAACCCDGVSGASVRSRKQSRAVDACLFEVRLSCRCTCLRPLAEGQRSRRNAGRSANRVRRSTSAYSASRRPRRCCQTFLTQISTIHGLVRSRLLTVQHQPCSQSSDVKRSSSLDIGRSTE